MGGGDLNSKKSWHPNTIKNQERVWKAEQAAAEEKKRIIELQRERGEERDRAELNEMAQRNCGISSATATATASDNRLHWMYEKPDRKELQEDYLLGKAIDKNQHSDKTETNIIPAVARRVVGSSMLTTSEEAQVDLARKVREDPLLLVKERERAARAALLNNPLQRRKLTELLRKEQEQKKESKIQKKLKSKDKDLDNILAAKLNALGGDKHIDLSALLASEDSSSDSSSERQKYKSKKKKKKHEKDKIKSKKSKKKKKKEEHDDDDDCSKNVKIESNDKDHRYESPSRHKSFNAKKQHKSKRRRMSVSDDDSYSQVNINKGDKHSHNDHKARYLETKRSRRESFDESQSSRKTNSTSKQVTKRKESDEHRDRSKRAGPSEEERAARLKAMMAAGAEREVDRGRRVARQRATDSATDNTAHRPSALLHNEARALPESLESRIHSNRHYIQRDRRHMNEHFARR